MEDRLTIAIPVYNRSSFFTEALESALRQTVPVRILVVDNDSTAFDFAAAVHRYADPRIRYIRNERNVGMAGNWNRCIEHCETEYLAIVHDDDRVAPEFVERLQPLLDRGAAVIFSRSYFIDETGAITGEQSQAEYDGMQTLADLCVRNVFYTGIAFRVDLARQLGGFRAQFRFTPDFDFWFRVALHGGFLRSPGILGYYRRYESAERITTQCEANYGIAPRMSNQVRRNLALYRRQRPGDPPPQPQPLFIGFAEMLALWKTLSPHRARYVLAVYVNSNAQSATGRLLRALFRRAGRLLCWLATGRHFSLLRSAR